MNPYYLVELYNPPDLRPQWLYLSSDLYPRWTNDVQRADRFALREMAQERALAIFTIFQLSCKVTEHLDMPQPKPEPLTAPTPGKVHKLGPFELRDDGNRFYVREPGNETADADGWVLWAEYKQSNLVASDLVARQLTYVIDRVAHLESVLNTPEIHDFTKATILEAAHQRERWGSAHDAGKTPAEWLWLIAFLATKALTNPPTNDCACPSVAEAVVSAGVSVPSDLAASAEGQTKFHLDGCRIDKQLHRIVTVAAAACNWHAAVAGTSNTMRPGLAGVDGELP